MAMRRGTVRRITPVTQTEVAVERPFESYFTPNWDKEAGAAQQMIGVKARTRQGQIKVSRGGGVAARDKG